MGGNGDLFDNRSTPCAQKLISERGGMPGIKPCGMNLRKRWEIRRCRDIGTRGASFIYAETFMTTTAHNKIKEFFCILYMRSILYDRNPGSGHACPFARIDNLDMCSRRPRPQNWLLRCRRDRLRTTHNSLDLLCRGRDHVPVQLIFHAGDQGVITAEHIHHRHEYIV